MCFIDIFRSIDVSSATIQVYSSEGKWLLPSTVKYCTDDFVEFDSLCHFLKCLAPLLTWASDLILVIHIISFYPASPLSSTLHWVCGFFFPLICTSCLWSLLSYSSAFRCFLVWTWKVNYVDSWRLTAVYEKGGFLTICDRKNIALVTSVAAWVKECLYCRLQTMSVLHCNCFKAEMPLASCYEMLEYERALFYLIPSFPGRDIREVSLSLIVHHPLFYLFYLTACLDYWGRDYAFKYLSRTHQRLLMVFWRNVKLFAIPRFPLLLVLFIMSFAPSLWRSFKGHHLLLVSAHSAFSNYSHCIFHYHARAQLFWLFIMSGLSQHFHGFSTFGSWCSNFCRGWF